MKNQFGLTSQQIEAIDNLSYGMERKTIANAMGLSVKTVEFHLAKAMEHLKIGGDKALIRWAIDNGFGKKREAPASPLTPVIIRDSDQLAKVLLNTCEEAANGRANPVQSNIMCQCAGVLIDLYRLKMEINARNRNP